MSGRVNKTIPQEVRDAKPAAHPLAATSASQSSKIRLGGASPQYKTRLGGASPQYKVRLGGAAPNFASK